MIDETKVTTSVCNGTTINMGAISTKYFLENLAITTIAQCREMISKEKLGVLESTTNLPHYDDLVSKYCSGVHGAILVNMLAQNIHILYNFVEDCVMNETVRGLYLWHEKSACGEPAWKLITLALDEYMKLIKKEYEILGREIPSDIPEYNEYNEKFEKLMLGV